MSTGIKEIRDLLDNDRNFLSYNTFINKYSIKTNYILNITFSDICCSTLQESTHYSLSWPNSKGSILYPSVSNQSFQEKLIYECLINEKASIPSRSQGKWLEESSKLGKYVLPIHLCVQESQSSEHSNLNSFTEKSPHANDILYKIAIKQTDSCSFCEEQKETLIHLFWTCKHTQNFWNGMFEWISQNFKDLENVSPSLSLCFGLDHWRRKRPSLSSPSPYS